MPTKLTVLHAKVLKKKKICHALSKRSQVEKKSGPARNRTWAAHFQSEHPTTGTLSLIHARLLLYQGFYSYASYRKRYIYGWIMCLDSKGMILLSEIRNAI